MQAIRIHAFGGPENLHMEEVPQPNPTPGEVLIRVAAAGINPVDWKVRQNGGLNASLPWIPGWDVSGIVVELGSDVTSYAPGDPVYGLVRFPQSGNAYAEYVAAPITEITRKPETIDSIQAAAVPLVALTAWQALFEKAELASGETIVIHAAAGGVGHIAVQLAKWRGATVIGTGSARNEAFLREIGVDQFVDYTAAPFETVVPKVDVVLNAVDRETAHRSLAVVKDGGRLVNVAGGPSDEVIAHYPNVRVIRHLVYPSGAQLDEISTLIDAKKVKPVLQATFPLAEARQGQELVAGGHVRGKVVLRVY